MNKVPRKKGYVPNMYTGRSMMRYGGMERKKAAMGMSKMDEDMMGSMRQQMLSLIHISEPTRPTPISDAVLWL